jgi:hypothetical protein
MAVAMTTSSWCLIGMEIIKYFGHAHFMYSLIRGPVVLLRTEFGVLSRGKMGPTELVSEYLRSGKTNEVCCTLFM